MNNPPAFPHSHLVYSRGQVSYEDCHYADGMTLRDYFAAAALRGRIALNERDRGGCSFPEFLDHEAGVCYSIADAMLKAREQ